MESEFKIKIKKVSKEVKEEPKQIPVPTEKILSISLRPQKLDDVVGLDDVVETVKEQFKSGRIPHFFLITGISGSGKTTLARIIALMLQHTDNSKIDYSQPLSKYDIQEINGSDKNGIDDIRELLETVRYRPHLPSLAKVIIMDEAHQLTTQAQNALLKVTEDTPKYSFFIFCTTAESKIIPALKRRAYILHTHSVDRPAIHKLLLTAAQKVEFKESTDELEEELDKYDIGSPGLILQAAEKFFSGADLLDCIFNTTETTVDTKKLCNLLSKADWKNLLPLLKTIKKEDIIVIKICIMGYFKTILLNPATDYIKAKKIALAMSHISTTYKFDDDLPSFLACIFISCDIIKGS
jgi:DNA polymerase III gamma/tau subunit